MKIDPKIDLHNAKWLFQAQKDYGYENMKRDKKQLVKLNDRQFEMCIAGTISQNRTSIMKPSQLAKMKADDPRLVINFFHIRKLTAKGCKIKFFSDVVAFSTVLQTFFDKSSIFHSHNDCLYRKFLDNRLKMVSTDNIISTE